MSHRTRLLRRAAKAAGIDEYQAERISDYDFRHSAATHLGRTSDNLPGVMYLLGDKQPPTTGRDKTDFDLDVAVTPTGADATLVTNDGAHPAGEIDGLVAKNWI